jgi:transitional endoplasmic reticulum ATPase
VPLRQHLAELLLSIGELAAAEAEFSAALALAPDAGALTYALELGLARSYDQQGKDAQALALLKALVQKDATHSEALSLHAQLCFLMRWMPSLAAGAITYGNRAFAEAVRVFFGRCG